MTSLCLAAVLSLQACHDWTEDISQPHDPAGLPILLSGSIQQQNVTRVGDYGFVGGDRMGVYIVDYDDGQPGTIGNGNRASNLIYTFDANGCSWSAPTTVYWRDRETPVDVYAYYPAANYISEPGEYGFEVQADQSLPAGNGDLCSYEQSDLLWGKQTRVVPTTSVITVKLAHALAGVYVQIMKGTGITDTEWEKLQKTVLVENTVRQSTVSLSTGTVTVSDGSDIGAIRMCPQSGGAYRAVVIPQTVAAGRALLSITIDGRAYAHTLTSPMKYQAGKLHNFSITVNKSETTGDYAISVTNDGITPWVNDEQSHQFESQQYVVVHCPNYGTLKQCIADAGLDYRMVQNLKVTGELTTEDFELLRKEMPELKHLNLKDVKLRHILTYNGWWDHGSHDYDRFADDMLPNDAFYQNHTIRSIVLPSTLKRIGRQAFRETQLMNSTLEIPEGVTFIDEWAFAITDYVSSTVELILPSTIDSICSLAFYNTDFNCEFNLSDNIKYLASNVVYNGNGRGAPNFHGTLHIPSRLTAINPGIFCGLGSNGSFTGQIEIPQGITEIGDDAFGMSMANRLKLTLPMGVKRIGNHSFGGHRFASISFNDDLEEIGYKAFEFANIPFELELPQGLTSIGSNAFIACGIEGELVIPENCLKLEGGVFADNHITKIVFPSKLEMIPGGAFCCNDELQQVMIPKYVNFIGLGAFASCPNIGTVICLSEEPPILEENVFGQWEPWRAEGIHFDKCILEVPEKSVELYRHADGWKQFQNITAYHELAFNIPEIVCLDKGTTRQGIIRAEGPWEVSECPDWVTVSPSSGSNKAELTITVKPGTSSRDGRIVFRLKDKNYSTYTDVRQVFSADYREDATVTLQEASAGATPVPLFIVGEGYGADDIASGKYLSDIKEQMEHLFSTEPYKSLRQYFTVSTAYACSPESGMSGRLRFQSDDWWENSNDLVWQYAQNHGTAINDHAAILVLCNTESYSNHTDLWDNGQSFTWIGKTTDLYPYDQRGEVLHYLGGRAIGKLGPEYVNHFTFMKACGCPGCNMTNEYNWARQHGWWQNVSTTPKMTEVPWQHLIFHEKYAQQVDIYEGALNHARSTYRSENQSVMGAVHIYYYNAISRYEIMRRVMQAAGKSISLEQFIATDKIELPENE